MISFPANTEIFIFHRPVSFGCGVDGMIRYCKLLLSKEVIENAYFLFISKSLKQIRAIWFDGQGFLLCTKRMSKGSFKNWPKSSNDASSIVSFFEAQSLFSDGDYKKAQHKKIWKKIS